MDTLKNNLHKSTLLPFDVMMRIYEYADTLKPIRNQLEKKEFDLDDIMYERMKKYILANLQKQSYYYLYSRNLMGMIEINNNNIHDKKLKNNFLNDNNGYRHFF